MAKKEWTAEERKAFGEKMKAAKAKKAVQAENAQTVEAPLQPHNRRSQSRR
jgi:hypothetical protein